MPISQVEQLTGKQVTFYTIDLLDYKSLSKVFDKVSCIIYYISLFNSLYNFKFNYYCMYSHIIC